MGVKGKKQPLLIPQNIFLSYVPLFQTFIANNKAIRCTSNSSRDKDLNLCVAHQTREGGQARSRRYRLTRGRSEFYRCDNKVFMVLKGVGGCLE